MKGYFGFYFSFNCFQLSFPLLLLLFCAWSFQFKPVSFVLFITLIPLVCKKKKRETLLHVSHGRTHSSSLTANCEKYLWSVVTKNKRWRRTCQQKVLNHFFLSLRSADWSVMAAYGQTQYSPALQPAGPYTPYTHHTQGYTMPSYSKYIQTYSNLWDDWSFHGLRRKVEGWGKLSTFNSQHISFLHLLPWSIWILSLGWCLRSPESGSQ